MKKSIINTAISLKNEWLANIKLEVIGARQNFPYVDGKKGTTPNGIAYELAIVDDKNSYTNSEDSAKYEKMTILELGSTLQRFERGANVKIASIDSVTLSGDNWEQRIKVQGKLENAAVRSTNSALESAFKRSQGVK